MKKIFKVSAIVLLALLVILFITPFLFRGKIIELAKTEINKNINAKADFHGIDISLFRKFPRVSVAIDQLSIVGKDNFSADTLLAAQRIEVALDLMSVIRGSDMQIHSIDVKSPRIHAIVPKTGKANWDIMIEDSASTTSDTAAATPFHLELQRYSIENAYISYRDEASNMSSEIYNLSHEGSGDFNADVFTLKTKTSADAVSFTYGKIPYLKNAKASIGADIQIDNSADKYSFKTEDIALNELKLAAEGFFQFVNDTAYNMDISFNAPSTDFKHILSLIPAVYQQDFANIKTSGKAVFNGFVKGIMAGEQMPAYTVNLEVENGFFQYPDLPAPVKNINLALKAENPDGIPDHTIVNIPHAHFEMENAPFDFRLLLKTPISDMWIDAAAKGKLDLSNITRMVKLEQGTQLKGLLDADVSVKGYTNAVQKQQFDKFTAAGTLQLNGFNYRSKDYPDGVALDKLLMTFNPKNVTLNEASGQYLKTGFSANGSINNLIAYALNDKPLDGVLNLKADKMNLNDWMGTAEADSVVAQDTATGSGPFIVPANLDILVNAQVDQVKYDKLTLDKVSGSLHIANEAVKLDNIKSNALGGTLAVSGSYSTKENKRSPAIALQYDVQGVDIEKAFKTFNTVEKLMPIGKFLAGKVSSQLSMTGKLGENMFPDLSSLTGNGNILLIEGILQKFKPLENLADRLQVNALKDLTLREVREHFEFAQGKVLVAPFKVNVKDIEMEIGGMHGFDQSMDYALRLNIPRSIIGEKGNQLVNDLFNKAAGKGIPLKASETVNLNVQMLGSIAHPDLRIDLKESAKSLADDLKQQTQEFVQAKVDSARKIVADTLQALKKEAVKEVSNRLKEELFGKKDTAATADTSKTTAPDPQTRIKESAKGLLENINPLKKKKTDSIAK
ncbi:MAG: AsmA family protein [Chitinophagaceae bacterium]|nr:AsmA family protein [Chitinophagaceae bacterium]